MLEFFIASADIAGWLLKIYAWTHIAAFILGWIQADSKSALVSFVNIITIPAWRRMARSLPSGLASWAPYFVLTLIIFAEIFVPGVIRSLGGALSGNIDPGAGLKNVVLYFLFGGFYIISNVIGFVAILSVIYFVFSLVGSPFNNPIVRSIVLLLEPLISSLRRFIPRAGIDLSPLALALIAFVLKKAADSLVFYIQTGIII